MRILIAEDDPVSRLILQSAVEQFNHECLVADDGHEAWALLQSEPVDVVISDRIMPGLDGLELCRRMRAETWDGYRYFIFLTALNERTELVAGIEAGADDYLFKPLNPDELHVRLLVASRITRLHRQLTEQQVELRHLNDRLFDQARRDGLTQLGNRLRLREELELVEAGCQRDGRCFCAIMCDIDHFKAYNDHFGHGSGDEVLQAVAGVFVAQCRAADQLFRYGGEEFLIILADQPLDVAVIVAERLRRTVEALGLPLPGAPSGNVTISVGVAALMAGSDCSVRAWLAAADNALYEAKAYGRNRVVAAELIS